MLTPAVAGSQTHLSTFESYDDMFNTDLDASTHQGSKELLLSLHASVQRLSNKIDAIMHILKSINGTAVTIDTSQVNDLKMFPLNSKETLIIVENRIQRDVDFRCAVEHMLLGVGGIGIREITRRMLRGLMTNSLATNYSFLGKSRKASFSSLALQTVLKCAVFKLANYKNEKEYQLAVMNWLKNAPMRRSNS